MNLSEPVAFDQAEINWAFPNVDPGNAPLGGRVLVQLRRTKKKTAGKIILVEETKEAEKWNGQVAKVIAIGPLAYRHRDTMALWPEGTWAAVGDYVRVPKWGGDRWEVPDPNNPDEDPALFMIMNDHELITKVTGNPLSVKAYI
jgi:co-chaperonin GroES (HSP10)